MKKTKCQFCLGTGTVQDSALIGGLLKARRKAGQAVVAKRMGIDPSFLSLLEAGKRNWSLDLVKRYKANCK